MDIATWSGQNALGLFVDSLNDLEILFNTQSPQVLDFFGHCFQETPSCQKVENVQWSMDLDSFVFGQNSSKIDEARTNEALNEIALKSVDEKDKQHKQITLKMLTFGQIFHGHHNGKQATLGDLLEIFAKASDLILNSEFVRVLVDHFYDESQKKVIKFCFIPFAIYFLSTICYMSNFVISGQVEMSEASRDEVINSVKENEAFDGSCGC